MTKDEIYEAVKADVIEHHGEDSIKRGGCIFWTLSGLKILHREGYQALPQAGNLQWPIVTHQTDDGVGPTHFSYMWSPKEFGSVLSIVQGGIPEIHTWIGLADTREIIDFSTGYLRYCAEGMGFKWKAPDPPKYLWMKEFPRDVYYTPVREAIIYLVGKITRNKVVIRLEDFTELKGAYDDMDDTQDDFGTST